MHHDKSSNHRNKPDTARTDKPCRDRETGPAHPRLSGPNRDAREVKNRG
jgi:hypothetical protein